MRKEPFPHRMPAALQIELEPFALKDEHDSPPEQDEGAEHRRESTDFWQGIKTGHGHVCVNEIMHAVSDEIVVEFFLNGGRVASIFGGDSMRLGVAIRSQHAIPAGRSGLIGGSQLVF